MRWMALLSVLLFLPATAFALQMNEIMYDLPGSDGGREWVEVWQDGTDCANLTQWKFFEANTNHGITLKQGDPAVCSGGYAVIADDADKFLLDNVGYSGNLFDSSFSLSNTGETLALKNPDGNITDSVSYSGAWGAAGNGKSLERSASGWFESLSNSTPGALNSLSQSSQAQNQSQPQQTEQSQNQNSAQNAEQAVSQEQSYQEPVSQPSQPSQSDINPSSDYSPLIDFSIIGRSNHVPPGSSIEAVLSARSSYLADRNVVFCTYVTAVSDEACQNVELAPDEPVELRFYNTLKANVSGNLTLVAELRDGISVRQKTASLDVLSVSKPSEAKTGVAGPTAAFAAKNSDWLSQFIGWLGGLFSFR